MKIIKYIIPILLLFFACNQDEFDISNDGIRVTQIIIDESVSQEFSYYGNGLLNEEKSKNIFTKNNYNKKGQLISSDHYYDWRMVSSNSSVLADLSKKTAWTNSDNTEKSVTNNYEYDKSGHLVRRRILRSNYDGCVQYIYNSKNRISRTVDCTSDADKNYKEYQYDEVGNLIRQNNYHANQAGTFILASSTEYEFDNMKNPFYGVKGNVSPGVFTNPNNIIKENYKAYSTNSSMIEYSSTFENNYEYNALGYPVRQNGSKEYKY